jgi:hypothetical protein
MEEENIVKNKIVPLIIGVIAIAVLVIGATFAYYIVNSSNTTTTTAGRLTMKKAGTVSLIQGVENIYLNTTAEQMEEKNTGTDYYGVDDADDIPATTPQEHVLATIEATGGDDDTVYQCTMGYSISVSQIEGSSNSAYAALNSSDAEIVIDVVPEEDSENSALSIIDSYPLRQSNTYLNVTGTSLVRINGNTSLDIIGDLILHNLNSDQTRIVDIGADVSFEITSFSCNPIEPATLTLANDNGTIGKIDKGDEITLGGKTIVAGQEVTISNENFYVVSSDENETVLLAKYNLLVGDVYDKDGSTYSYRTLSSSDDGYGLQSSEAKGYVGTNHWVGTVPFSGTNYWDDSVCEYTGRSRSCTGTSNLNSKYAKNGASYDGNPLPYIYNSSMSNIAPSLSYPNNLGYAQNNGYTIAYYVENYVKLLGINGIGKLLDDSELNALGCYYDNVFHCSNLPSWFSNGTTFWVGTTDHEINVYQFFYNENMVQSELAWGYYGGVRPVIVVPTASIQTS